MLLTSLEYKSSKTRNQDLIEFHATDDLPLPFEAKNKFDKDPPFLFIQHASYIEIWDIGYYTDYPATWARAIAHFAYTINELLGGEPMEIMSLKEGGLKTAIGNVNQFQHEWLNKYTGYRSVVEELTEIGLHM